VKRTFRLRLNHDVMLYIIKFCDINTLTNLYSALPVVRDLVAQYPNTVFKHLVSESSANVQLCDLFFQELCIEFVNYIEQSGDLGVVGVMWYINVFTTFGKLNILKKLIDDKDYNFAIWNALLKKPSFLSVRFRSYKKLLVKLPSIFIKTGCNVSEDSLIQAILCSDKASVKTINMLYPNMSIASHEAERPFLFQLIEKFTIIENKLTQRRRLYVWSILADLKKNGAKDIWVTPDKQWTITSYYHFLVEQQLEV